MGFETLSAAAGNPLENVVEKPAEAVENPSGGTEKQADSFDPDKRIEPGEQNIAPENNAPDYDPDRRIVPDEEKTSPEADTSDLEPEENAPDDTAAPDKVYNDDNGNPYRVNGELVPDNEFTKDGYTYKTDSQGRPVSAEGKLQLKDQGAEKTPLKETMDDIGKGDERSGDDRGHLIADMFKGSGGLENLVPMDAHLNRGEYKSMENTLAKAVKNGDSVYFKVEPVYQGDSHRPSSFKATYTINGEKTVKVFQNGVK